MTRRRRAVPSRRPYMLRKQNEQASSWSPSVTACRCWTALQPPRSEPNIGRRQGACYLWPWAAEDYVTTRGLAVRTEMQAGNIVICDVSPATGSRTPSWLSAGEPRRRMCTSIGPSGVAWTSRELALTAGGCIPSAWTHYSTVIACCGHQRLKENVVSACAPPISTTRASTSAVGGARAVPTSTPDPPRRRGPTARCPGGMV